jgi:DNA-binding SARP family transcriptional activator
MSLSPQSAVRIRCLGVFMLESDGVVHIMQPCRRTQLFAMLVLNSGIPVATERLMREVWDEEPPDKAKNAMYAQIVRLRRDLDEWNAGDGPVLRTQFPGYELDLGAASLDVLDFQTLAAQARQLGRDDPDRAITTAERALALWSGPAFTAVTLGPRAEGTRRNLDENRFALLLDTMQLRLDRGEDAQLLPDLQELVHGWPLCERLHALLMTALYRTGRLADALHAFKTARERFRQELGAEPSPQLSRLVTLMLRHDPAMWHGPVYGAAA